MFLTRAQLIELTGYSKYAAQARALNTMGIAYKRRADGSIAVLTTHVEREMGGTATSKAPKRVEPNWGALNA